MKQDIWHRVAEHAGRSLGSDQTGLLEEYGEWLLTEGLAAGGIGPSEAARLEARHIGDSLAFAAPMPDSPDQIWDLGSGVGLPGIPLAILYPKSEVVLVDRSRRRMDLARRAVRVLGLANVRFSQAEISEVPDIDLAVSRATLPPADMATAARKWLRPGGLVIQGGSWHSRPTHSGWETYEIPEAVLDYTVWLLIMHRRD